MAAAASLITFLVIRMVLSQDDNHTLYFMILGLTAALAKIARPPERAGAG
jgi:hypothetical protein